MSEEGELNSEGCSAMIAEAPIDDDQKEKMKGMPEECAKEGCEKLFKNYLYFRNEQVIVTETIKYFS